MDGARERKVDDDYSGGDAETEWTTRETDRQTSQTDREGREDIQKREPNTHTPTDRRWLLVAVLMTCMSVCLSVCLLLSKGGQSGYRHPSFVLDRQTRC